MKLLGRSGQANQPDTRQCGQREKKSAAARQRHQQQCEEKKLHKVEYAETERAAQHLLEINDFLQASWNLKSTSNLKSLGGNGFPEVRIVPATKEESRPQTTSACTRENCYSAAKLTGRDLNNCWSRIMTPEVSQASKIIPIKPKSSQQHVRSQTMLQPALTERSLPRPLRPFGKMQTYNDATHRLTEGTDSVLPHSHQAAAIVKSQHEIKQMQQAIVIKLDSLQKRCTLRPIASGPVSTEKKILKIRKTYKSISMSQLFNDGISKEIETDVEALSQIDQKIRNHKVK